MQGYGMLLIGSYFLGAVAIAFILAIVSIWWSRSPLFKMAALLSVGGLVLLNYYAVDDLLSRPKPVTFKELQNMLPDEHPGHLVLYGETKKGAGIYLLLRSPNHQEPRYYFMYASDAEQEQFQDAKREAHRKKTQLLLGGKVKKREGQNRNGKEGMERGDAKGKKKDERGGFDKSPDPLFFHPAPVSGGPEKGDLQQDGPVVIPTP